MPKVYLTEEQRKEAATQKYIHDAYTKISDGLAILSNREHLTQAQLARGVGVGPKAISKMMNQEEVRIDITSFFKVLKIVGLEVVRRDP